MKMYNNIKSHRDLLIDYAEAKRKECVYYWAKIANERINKYNENIVISDWRFIEEYRYLQICQPEVHLVAIYPF